MIKASFILNQAQYWISLLYGPSQPFIHLMSKIFQGLFRNGCWTALAIAILTTNEQFFVFVINCRLWLLTNKRHLIPQTNIRFEMPIPFNAKWALNYSKKGQKRKRLLLGSVGNQQFLQPQQKSHSHPTDLLRASHEFCTRKILDLSKRQIFAMPEPNSFLQILLHNVEICLRMGKRTLLAPRSFKMHGPQLRLPLKANRKDELCPDLSSLIYFKNKPLGLEGLAY